MAVAYMRERPRGKSGIVSGNVRGKTVISQILQSLTTGGWGAGGGARGLETWGACRAIGA